MLNIYYWIIVKRPPLEIMNLISWASVSVNRERFVRVILQTLKYQTLKTCIKYYLIHVLHIVYSWYDIMSCILENLILLPGHANMIIMCLGEPR